MVDELGLLQVLLRTIMADKGTYRDVALPAAAAAAADVEVAIHSSLFLNSSSPSLLVLITATFVIAFVNILSFHPSCY